MNIYLIRHGKTVYNLEDRMQGWADSPLLDESILRAKELGVQLSKELSNVNGLYSSDSLRAYHTLKSISEGMGLDHEIVTKESLREMKFGQAETNLNGEVWNNVALSSGYDSIESLAKELTGLQRCNLLHQMDVYSEAESADMLIDRVSKGFVELANEAKSEGHENVLIVSHGITILALLQFLGVDEVFAKSFDNLSVSKIVFNDNNFSVEYCGKSLI